MTSCVAIPIKAPDACKTRLRATLTDGERKRLVHSMLRHVITAARTAFNVDRLLLLTPANHGLSGPWEWFPDEGGGLNGELAKLTRTIAKSGCDRLVIVPADLPLVTAADMEGLIALPSGVVAIVPDRTELGTNALSLPLPAAQDFAFSFGLGSFARHCMEADRLRLPLKVLRSDTLAFDVDEPRDLVDINTWKRAHANNGLCSTDLQSDIARLNAGGGTVDAK